MSKQQEIQKLENKVTDLRKQNPSRIYLKASQITIWE